MSIEIDQNSEGGEKRNRIFRWVRKKGEEIRLTINGVSRFKKGKTALIVIGILMVGLPALAGALKSGGVYQIIKDVVSSGGGKNLQGASYSASAVIAPPPGYKSLSGGVYSLEGGYYGGHDESAPTVDKVVFLDPGGTGVITEMVVSFSEPISDSTVTTATALAAFSISSEIGTFTDLDYITDAVGFVPVNTVDPQVANDHFLTLQVSGYKFGTGTNSVTVSFSQQASAFQDHAGYQVETSSSLAVEDQAPAIPKYAQSYVGSNVVIVSFSENIGTNSGAIGSLVGGTDFVLTDTDGRTINSATIGGGTNFGTFAVNSNFDAIGDIGISSISTVGGQIYDEAGNTTPGALNVTIQDRALVWTGGAGTADPFEPRNWNGLRQPSGGIGNFDQLIIDTAGIYPDLTGGVLPARGLRVEAGATFSQNAGTLSLSGHLIENGTLSITGGQIGFQTSGNYEISASVLPQLILGGDGPEVTLSTSVTVAQAVINNGTLSMGQNIVLTVAANGIQGTGSLVMNGNGKTLVTGNMDMTGGTISCGNNCELHLKNLVTSLGVFTPGLGYVFYEGNAAQTVDFQPYNNLVISNSGQIASLGSGVLSVSGDFIVEGVNSQFNGGGFGIDLKGDLLVEGDHGTALTNARFILSGGAINQVISASGDIELEISKSAGIAQMTNVGNLLTINNFTLSAGEFDLNGKTLKLADTALVELDGGVFQADITNSKITSTNPGVDRYSLAVNGATISVGNLIVESVNADGFSFSSGTISAFDNVVWDQGLTRFASFGGALGAVTFNNHLFASNPGQNFRTILGSSGTINMVDATGSGAGPSREDQLGAAINWPGYATYAGNFDGVTPVSIAVNGVVKGTYSGAGPLFSIDISPEPVAGDKLYVYYDDNAGGNDGCLVTKNPGGSYLGNLNLSASTLILRNDQGASLSSAEMVTASPVDATDGCYTEAGNDITVAAQNAVYISAGYTINLGGLFTVNNPGPGLTIAGNLNASTHTLLSVGPLTVSSSGNLSFTTGQADISGSATISGSLGKNGGGLITVSGNFDATGGSVGLSTSANIRLRGPINTSLGAYHDDGTAIVNFSCLSACTIPGGTYGKVIIGGGQVNTLQGPFISTATSGFGLDVNSSGTILDLNGNSVALSAALLVGDGDGQTVTLAFNGATVEVSGQMKVYSDSVVQLGAGSISVSSLLPGTAEFGQLNLGGGQVTVNGTLNFTNGGASFSAPSTIYANGAITSFGVISGGNDQFVLGGSLVQTLPAGSLTNLSINKSGGAARLGAGLLVAGLTQLNNGVFDLNSHALTIGNNGGLNISGGVFVSDLAGGSLTSTNPGVDRFAFTLENAVLSVSNLVVNSLNADGFSASNPTITSFNGVNWTNGSNRYMTLGGAIGSQNFLNHTFSAILANNIVTAPGSTGTLNMISATGPGAGPTYEQENGAAVNWFTAFSISGTCPNNGATLKWARDGVEQSSTSCNAGNYLINAAASANQIITVYEFDAVNIVDDRATLAKTTGSNLVMPIPSGVAPRMRIQGSLNTVDLVTAHTGDVDMPWTVGGGIQLNAGSDLTIGTFATLEVVAAQPVTWTSGGSMAVSGILIVSNSAQLTASGSLTVTGQLVNSGSVEVGGAFDSTTGLVSLAESSLLELKGAITSLNGLDFSNSAVIKLSDATAEQTLNGPLSVPNLIVQKAAQNLTLNGNLTVSGGFTLTSGIVTVLEENLHVSGSTTISSAANSMLAIQSGSVTLVGPVTNQKDLSAGPGSLITMQGSYSANGVGTLRVNADSAFVKVLGSWTNTNTTQFTANGVVEIAGNLSNLGGLNIGAGFGTLSFSNTSGPTTLPNITYNNIVINTPGQGVNLGGASTNLKSLTLNGGTLNQTADIHIIGSWIENSGVFQSSAGTLFIDGTSSTQSITQIPGNHFNNLTVNKTAGSVGLTGPTLVSGDVTITSTLNSLAFSTHPLYVKGDFDSSAGVFTPTSGTVVISPSAAVSVNLGANNEFNHFMVDNNSGAANLISDTHVKGNFTKSGTQAVVIQGNELSVSGSGLISAGLVDITLAGAGKSLVVSGPLTQTGGTIDLGQGGYLKLGTSFEQFGGNLNNTAVGSRPASIASIDPGVVFPSVELGGTVNNTELLSASSLAASGFLLSPSLTVTAFDDVNFVNYGAGSTCLKVRRNSAGTTTLNTLQFTTNCLVNVDADSTIAGAIVQMNGSLGSRAGELYDVETGNATVTWGSPIALHSVHFFDQNADGNVDRAVVSFSQSLVDSTVTLADIESAFTIGGVAGAVAITDDNVGGSCSGIPAADPQAANDNRFTLCLDPAQFPGTISRSVAFSAQAGKFQDGNGNEAPSNGSVASVDKAPALINYVQGAVGDSNLLVKFSEPVWTNAGQAGDLVTGDFTMTDIDDSRFAVGVTHTGGNDNAILILSSVLDATNDINTDTIAAVAAEVFDAGDNSSPTTAITVTPRELIWTGATNTNMNNANNWSPVRVPSFSDVLILTTAGSQPPTVNATIQAGGVIVSQGATLVGSSNTLEISGNFIVNGSFAPGTGTISFPNAGEFEVSASTMTTLSISDPSAVVTLSRSLTVQAATISGQLSLGQNLSMTTTGGLTLAGNLTMNDLASLSVAGTADFTGGTLNCSASCSVALSGTLTDLGTFNPGTGTLTMAQSGVGAMLPAQVYHHLTINAPGQTIQLASGADVMNLTLLAGSFEPGVSFTINGNFNGAGGTLTPGTGTVYFAGSNAQTITTSAQTQFYDLSLNKTGGMATLATSIVVLNDLTVAHASDWFDPNFKTILVKGDFVGTGFVEFASGTIVMSPSTPAASLDLGLATGNFLNHLTIDNDGGNSLNLANNTKVEGNFHKSGTADFSVGNKELAVSGSLTLSAGAVVLNNGASPGSVAVSGPVVQSGGTLDFNFGGTLKLGTSFLQSGGLFQNNGVPATAYVTSLDPGVLWPSFHIGNQINNNQPLMFSYIANSGVVLSDTAALTNVHGMSFENFEGAGTCLKVYRAANVNLSFNNHSFDATCTVNVEAQSTTPSFNLTMVGSSGLGKGEPYDIDGSNAAVIWGTPIALSGSHFFDMDNDGELDRAVIEFTENVQDSTITTADAQAAFAINGLTGGTAAIDLVDGTTVGGGCGTSIPPLDPSITNDKFITLCLTTANFPSTAKPTVSFSAQVGKFQDVDLNDTPSSGSVLTVDAAPPVLKAAYGTIGSDQVFVEFSEAIYTSTGASGAPTPADFDLVDVDNSRTIISSGLLAGVSSGTIQVSSPLDGTNDIGLDTLAAIASSLFDASDNEATTTPATIGEGLVTWTGAIDDAWQNPANWSPARVPQVFDNVTITSAGAQPVVLTGSTALTGVTMDSGTLAIGSGPAITLSISGNLTGSATLTLDLAATLAFNGIVAQSMDRYNATRVVVDKPAGTLTINAAGPEPELTVTSLTLNSGTLNGNNQTIVFGDTLTLNNSSNLQNVALELNEIGTTGITLNDNATLSVSSLIQTAASTTTILDNRANRTISISGNLEVQAGTVAGPDSLFVVGGNVSLLGNFNATQFRVTNPATFTAAGVSIAELEIAGANTLTLGSELSVSGSISLSSGAQLDAASNAVYVSKDFDAAGNGNFLNPGVFTKTGAQLGVFNSATEPSIQSLQITDTGGLTLARSLTVLNEVIAAAPFNFPGANLKVGSNFTYSGLTNPGGSGSTLSFQGAAASLYSNSLTLNSILESNKNPGSTLTIGPAIQNISGGLLLTSGMFSAPATLAVRGNVINNSPQSATINTLQMVGTGVQALSFSTGITGLVINKPSESVQLTAALSLGTGGLQLTNGGLDQNGQNIVTAGDWVTNSGTTYTHSGGSLNLSASSATFNHQATGGFQNLTFTVPGGLTIPPGNQLAVANAFTLNQPDLTAFDGGITVGAGVLRSALTLTNASTLTFEDLQVESGILTLTGSAILRAKTGGHRTAVIHPGAGFRTRGTAALGSQNPGTDRVSLNIGGVADIASLAITNLSTSGIVLTPSATITALNGMNFGAAPGSTCLTIQRTGGPHTHTLTGHAYGANCLVNVNASGGGGTTTLTMASPSGSRAGENFDVDSAGATVAWGAAPIVVASRQFDMDNNGSIDEIAIQFDKSIVDASVNGTDAARFTWGGVSLVAVDNVTNATGSAKLNTFDPGVANDAFLTFFTNNAAGLGTGVRVLAYTNAADRIEDSLGNDLGTNASFTTTDFARPILLGRQTADLNQNGSIDAVRLSFSENISDSTVLGTNFPIAGVTGRAFSSAAAGDTANNNIIYITFNDGVLNTAAVPTVGYTPGTLADLAQNTMLTQTAVAAIDAARPVLLGRRVEDLNGNGVADAIRLSFSENISDASISAANFTVPGVAGLVFNATAGGDSANNQIAYLTFTEAGQNTAFSTTVAYSPGTLADANANTALTQTAAATTDGARPVILGRRTLDLNGNGFIDAIRLSFSEPISDASVTAANFSVAGSTGLIFSASAAGDVANNNLIYLSFTDSVFHTGATPQVAYTAGSLADANGNSALTVGAQAPTDGAKPVVISALAEENATLITGIDSDDTVTLSFSEPTNQPAITSGNLNALLALSGGKTWLSGGGQITSATWLTSSQLRITLATTGGQPTIAPGDTITATGGALADLSGNTAQGSIPLTGTFSGDTTQPSIVSVLTLDSNGNGFLDTIRLNLSKAISDGTVQAANFNLTGAGALTAAPNFGGDAVNNAILHFTFADSVLQSGLTPNLTYTQGTLTDIPGNLMAGQSLTATDGANPVLLSATASDETIVFNGLDNDDSITLVFSEATNQPVISAGNITTTFSVGSGRTLVSGNGTITSATWIAPNSLKIVLATAGGTPTITPSTTLTLIGNLIRGQADNLAAAGLVTLGGTFANDTTPPVFAGITGASTNNFQTGTVDISFSAATDISTPISYLVFTSTTSGVYNFASPTLTLTASASPVTTSVTGLTNDVAHFFLVRALDGAGNMEANGVEVSATPRNPDSDAPVVTWTVPPSGHIANQNPYPIQAQSEPGVTATINTFPMSVDANGLITYSLPVQEGDNLLTLIVADSNGNTTTLTRSLTIDSVPPTVAVLSPSSNTDTTPMGGVIEVFAQSDDNLGVFETYLEYGPGLNPTNWKTVATLSGSVSASSDIGVWDTTILQGTYTLRVRVMDFAGNITSDTKTIFVGNALVASAQVLTKGRWHFVTVPGNPVPNDPKQFLQGGLFNVRYWDPAEPNNAAPMYKYKSEFTVAAGQGFWVKTYDRDLTASYTFTPIDTTQDIVRPIAQGWNSIGAPLSKSMPLSAIRFREPGQGADIDFNAAIAADWVDTVVWTFDGNGFVQASPQNDMMDPYGAFFMNAKRPLEMVIKPGSGSADGVARMVRQPLPSFQIKVSGEVQNGLKSFQDLDNYIGLRAGASDVYDKTDRAEPPAVEDDDFLSVYLEGVDQFGAPARMATVNAVTANQTGEEKSFVLKVRTNQKGLVTVGLDTLVNENNLYSAVLVDPVDNKEIPLSIGRMTLTVDAPGGPFEKRYLLKVKRGGDQMSKVSASFGPGWNLVSFPIDAVPTKAAIQLGDDLTNPEIYQYYESAFSEVGKGEDVDLQAGLGFWLRLDRETTVDVEGVAIPLGTAIEVPIKAGWNLLGNPYSQAIPFGENILIRLSEGSEPITLKQAYESGLLQPPAYGQTKDQDYQPVEIFEPFKGYFIHSKVPAVIILKP